MSARRHHWLIRLFPRSWRERYGEEFLALLEVEGLTLAVLADTVKTAAMQWAGTLLAGKTFTQRRHAMTAGPKSLIALSTQPSAFVPVLMSFAAFAIVGAYIVATGGRHQTDEGAIAHIFQLLIAAQLPVVVFFILRWIRSRPWACLTLLAVQGLALALALLPVWYYRL
ncbi:MAG: hypothetical protein ACXU8O_01040 [Asticcacaulis sp.]